MAITRVLTLNSKAFFNDNDVDDKLKKKINARNRLRRDEINHLQNIRYAARQAANNLIQNEGNVIRQVEDNCRRNARNRLREDVINNQQNTRYAGRHERMHCIGRSNTIPDYNYLREKNHICQHCGAKKFPDETHFLCCHNGKVVLSQLPQFPQNLQDLFTGSYGDRNANVNFLKNIQNFYACLSFASFTANVVQPMNHGPPCFRICGQVFHCVGLLRPGQDIPPTYCIYNIINVVYVT
ncbi:uncharacterized protein LOC136092727 [Hydra vulgaris]|uniref:uncharacterized protein LOC136092727 n=1 Tax=Hydra vulgaris TaxID=6087 RepID=UPI0032EA6EA5